MVLGWLNIQMLWISMLKYPYIVDKGVFIGGINGEWIGGGVTFCDLWIAIFM